MKYLIYLALLAGSYALYLQLIKRYAKKVQKGYEPLEYEYDMADDEEKKKEILEKIAKLETKAFNGNDRIRTFIIFLVFISTVFILVLPSTQPIIDYIDWVIKYSTFVVPAFVILLLIAIFGPIRWYREGKNSFNANDDFYNSIPESLNTYPTWRETAKFTEQGMLNSVRPDRFPLAKYDILAGISLITPRYITDEQFEYLQIHHKLHL